MKPRLGALIPLLYLVTGCHQYQDEPATLTQLPVTVKEGYGPFYPGFGSLSEERPNDQLWGKIYLPLQGTPKHWSSLTKSMVWLDAHQLVYQNALAGKITPQNYQYLQKEWKWVPDTTKLSARSIRCYVYVIRGFDENRRQWAVMVDKNNNLDFSDETPFYPQPVDFKDRSYHYKDPQRVQYEVYQKGKVIRAYVPMVVKTMGSEFLYNFPQYAVTSLKRGDQTYQLLISSGFTRPDFERTDIALLSSQSNSNKIEPQHLVEIGENIELGGFKYKNKGVDRFHNWLELEPVQAQGNEYSLQAGYPFRPFKADEFSSGKTISLRDLKGKYVYVDFWGTWCKGCVDDMPTLKKVYRELDKTRFEFIGIVCHDSPQRLKRFVDEEQIGWPQLLANETNKLADPYHVTSYPTSVLINPEGIVIAKNLRGIALRDTLRKLSE